MNVSHAAMRTVFIQSYILKKWCCQSPAQLHLWSNIYQH